MRLLFLFTLLLAGLALTANSAPPTASPATAYPQYAISPFAQSVTTPAYPPSYPTTQNSQTLTPGVTERFDSRPVLAQPAAPVATYQQPPALVAQYRVYRMVDGVDAPARTTQSQRVIGVPRGQAPRAAARPAPQQQPTVVVINVYGGGGGGGSYGPPQNEYAYEYAYYNPVAPVYYRPWPEYVAYGRLWAWGVPHAYYNPPYGVCFYRYEYGSLGKYYRRARTNIYQNIRPSCTLPR